MHDFEVEGYAEKETVKDVIAQLLELNVLAPV